MADSTVRRVIAEASLARRHESEISDRASQLSVPDLVKAVESFDGAPDGDLSPTNEIELGIDTDGVPLH